MGKYYCDYCDIYLTHDSMSARKAHVSGRNHVSNVRDYFASLGHDKAQNIIDQIIQSHESGGGRQQMMMAPSMRLGAGFMNPLATGPAFPPNAPYPAQNAYPPAGASAGGAPPFRPPFPPQQQVNGAPPQFRPPPNFVPPFPPNVNGTGSPAGAAAGSSPFPPNGFTPQQLPPFPPQQLGQAGQQPPAPVAQPPTFTPASGPPAAGNPGIHPDRLRMLGQ